MDANTSWKQTSLTLEEARKIPGALDAKYDGVNQLGEPIVMVLMRKKNDEGIFTMLDPDGASLRAETALSSWFQTLPTEVLTAIVNGMVSAKGAATLELVMRGMSPTTGKWIGFDEAKREALDM